MIFIWCYYKISFHFPHISEIPGSWHSKHSYWKKTKIVALIWLEGQIRLEVDKIHIASIVMLRCNFFLVVSHAHGTGAVITHWYSLQDYWRSNFSQINLTSLNSWIHEIKLFFLVERSYLFPIFDSASQKWTTNFCLSQNVIEDSAKLP